MRLFRKNKTAGRPKQDELADQIAHRIIGVQERMATCLNSRTQHLSRQTKLLYLVIFCLLFAAINCWLLIGSITH